MIVILLIMLCLCVDPSVGQQTETLELPPQAQVTLYARFPRWRYAEVEDEVRQALKKDDGPNSRPDLISGDFDGDGQADYAALIEQDTTNSKAGESVGSQLYLVVFLQRQRGFKLHVIEDPGGGYLQLVRKGDGSYDYEAQKEFTYEHDAIFAGIFEKGGTSYVYEHGKFRAIITSD